MKLPKDVVYLISKVLIDLHHSEYMHSQDGRGGYGAVWENFAKHKMNESLCFSVCLCVHHINYRKLWIGKKFSMSHDTLYAYFQDRRQFIQRGLITEKSLLVLLQIGF